MTADEFPNAPSARPVWLITLADLALLLVGFFVLIQANQKLDGKALADGLRQGFGVAKSASVPATTASPMPVTAAAMPAFASGSAALPGSPSGLIAWARDAAQDPRVTLRITGSTDGSSADVDPVTGSAAVLAADRARAVALVLAAARIAPGRTTIVNADAASSRHRQVIVTSGFSGEQVRP